MVWWRWRVFCLEQFACACSWFSEAMAGWWRGLTLLLVVLCSVSLSSASDGKSSKRFRTPCKGFGMYWCLFEMEVSKLEIGLTGSRFRGITCTGSLKILWRVNTKSLSSRIFFAFSLLLCTLCSLLRLYFPSPWTSPFKIGGFAFALV